MRTPDPAPRRLSGGTTGGRYARRMPGCACRTQILTHTHTHTHSHQCRPPSGGSAGGLVLREREGRGKERPSSSVLDTSSSTSPPARPAPSPVCPFFGGRAGEDSSLNRPLDHSGFASGMMSTLPHAGIDNNFDTTPVPTPSLSLIHSLTHSSPRGSV